MWRDLEKISAILNNKGWKRLRSKKFDLRAKEKRHYIKSVNECECYRSFLNYGNTKFKVGKRYDNHTVNIVPVSFPQCWITNDAYHWEIFINEDDWKKFFPYIFSGSSV